MNKKMYVNAFFSVLTPIVLDAIILVTLLFYCFGFLKELIIKFYRDFIFGYSKLPISTSQNNTNLNSSTLFQFIVRKTLSCEKRSGNSKIFLNMGLPFRSTQNVATNR